MLVSKHLTADGMYVRGHLPVPWGHLAHFYLPEASDSVHSLISSTKILSAFSVQGTGNTAVKKETGSLHTKWSSLACYSYFSLLCHLPAHDGLSLLELASSITANLNLTFPSRPTSSGAASMHSLPDRPVGRELTLLTLRGICSAPLPWLSAFLLFLFFFI